MIWLLLFYMWLFIHRPFEVWPWLGTMRIELVYVLVVVAIWLVAGKKQWMPNPLHRGLFAFAAAVLVCWLASPWRTSGALVVENYFKLLAFYVLLVTSVNDEKRLKMLVVGFLVIMAIYLGHSLREYRNGRHEFRMGIDRMIGVDTSMSDPNTFGCSILYSLPLVIPVWQTLRKKWVRWALIGYMALAVLCILLTGSREALVGLVFLAGCIVFTTRRRLVYLLTAAVVSLVAWTALPPALQTRFETIIYPEVGPANAQVSAEDRTQGLIIGWGLLQSYPITGVGPGAWRPATSRPIEAHNLYGQLMGEMGLPGVATFLAILWLFWANVRDNRQLYRNHPEWKRDFIFYLNRAIGLAVILLLLEGNFGHNLYRYTWLWYGGFLIIAGHALRQRGGRALVSRRPAITPGRRLVEQIG